MARLTLADRIAAPGPKRLLAIAGGGIRGLIAIEFLSRVESVLRDTFGKDDLVLADYFDYVGGTSTGAIIATLVSLGYSTADIRAFYVDGAETMFEPSNVFHRMRRRLAPNGLASKVVGAIGAIVSPNLYSQRALAGKMRSVIGTETYRDERGVLAERDTTLGTARLRTLLLLVMRNASTNSPWPISNNPSAMYNRPSTDGSNLDLPLWQLVRASAAAPVFFPPEVIGIGGRRFVFVDGGITVYHNPSFLLFLMSTMEQFGVRWPLGERDLLLVSVGTGLVDLADAALRPDEMNLVYNLQALPAALIHGGTVEQDMLCRVFGRLRSGDPIDSELGDLTGAGLPLDKKLFTYVRYNVDLTRAGLDALGLDRVDAKSVQRLDSIDNIAELRAIGEAAALRDVSAIDYRAFPPAAGG
jgi:patatin-like phospholipase/acyl hydrolase